MKCNLVKDLLSKYILGLCGKETAEEIKKHLDECQECRAAYEEILAAGPRGTLPSDKKILVLKKFNELLRRNKIITAVLVCALVLGGIVIFAKNHYLTIPFDPDHMSVELFKVAALTNEYGYTQWEQVDWIKDILPENNDKVMDAVQLVYKGINNISGDVTHRTVNRNGGEVRVFYYCYQESLWDSWFEDPDLRRGGAYWYIYRKGDYEMDYDLHNIEIYYLPVKNLDKLDKLSDEEFDRQRENGLLIWSGIA